jgi:GNAT acetyltransferase-like protein/acetyltransferase (GNAT) family protein
VAALVEDRLVGTGGAAGYGRDLAWVCMILVDPAHRGRGIGAALTRAVVERLTAFDCVGLDATPAGRPVYARLGFREHRALRRLFRDARAGDIEAILAAEETPRVRPMRDHDLPGVLALDREVFGADRGSLLGWMRARGTNACWIGRSSAGETPSYCLGRPGDHSFQVGPVVATTVETGLALVRAALAGNAGRRVVIDADDRRSDWIAALREVGFEEERPLVRMYRGSAPIAPRADLQLAILGPEFG